MTLVSGGHILENGDGDPLGDGVYLKNPGLNPNDGTVYVVAGHGGQSVNGIGGHPVMSLTEVAFGSALLHVNGPVLTLRNLRSDGLITDVFSIDKSNTVSRNLPPVANSGPDQTVEDSDENGVESVTLDESGSSDPDGTIVSYEWQSDGVILGTTAVVTADFSLGSHPVMLTVRDDQGATHTDTMLLSVTPAGTSQSLRVASGSDDAEECVSTQAMYLNSSDLELVSDSTFGCFGPQIVGLRFQQVLIPPAARIVRATLHFTVDEPDSGLTDLAFRGEAVDDALGFSPVPGDISSRSVTAASVSWLDVPAWSGAGSSGASQQSPDLLSIVQEIVDRPGWSSGNALVLMVSGVGERTAESYDGSTQQAPLLEIVWQTN